MSKPVMDYQNFLWRLFRALSDLRLAGDSPSVAWYEVRSLISRGQCEGFLSVAQVGRLEILAHNALNHSPDLRFPDERNAGPYMPTSVWFKRHKAALAAESTTGVIHLPGYYVVDPVRVKPQAQGSTNDRSCAVSPAPTASQGMRLPGLLCPQSTGQDIRLSPSPARRQLRLLCVLREKKLGVAPHIVELGYVPIHTMHRVPPRAMVKGKWSQPRYAGLYLRETHATVPTGEVLERCERHRQTHALRAPARTVRTGGVSA